MEILDAPAPESGSNPLLGPGAVRELPYTAWVNIQTGCDNSCAFCIVPSVRGPEVSRPLDDIVAEVGLLARSGVTEVTLLGQNVNSYGRDITKRRPLFAELLRAVGGVEGIGRVRFTSPHPKDLRPETIAAMAETPEVCEQLHLPLQSGSDAVLAGHAAWLHRGALPRAPRRRPSRHRRPGGDDRHHRRLPGGDGGGLRGHAGRLRRGRVTTAPTRSSSRRVPGTSAADMAAAFVPAEVVAERFERLKTVVDRSALARYRARIGRSEEALVEGVSRRDESMLTGRTRQGKLIHFPAGTPAGTPTAGRAGPRHRDRRPSAPPLRPPGGGDGAAPASRAHPGGGRLTAVALVGVTASGKSEAALQLALRRGDCEIVSVDSMCVYRGMDIGTSKPGPEARAAVPHHLLDLVDPDEDFSLTQFQQAARGGAAGHRPPRAITHCSSAAPACTCGRWSTTSTIPGRYPDVAAALEAELDEGRAERADVARPPGGARPGGRGAHGADQPSPGRARAGGHLGSGRPFSTFGPGLEAYPGRRDGPGRAWHGRPRRSTAGIAARFDRMVEDGLVDEVRALAARPAGISRTARQALGYREILAHVEEAPPCPTAWSRRCGAPGSSPGARPRGSAATRGCAGPRAARRPSACWTGPSPCTAERTPAARME